MSITFTMTARELIAKAMKDRWHIAMVGTPTDPEFDYGLTCLNLMLKTWGARGLTLWTDQDATVTALAGEILVPLDPRPVDVNDVRLTLNPNYDRPMQRWEKGEYDQMPNKRQVGEPLIYSPAYTDDSVSLRLWPVPQKDYTISYSYSRVINDVVMLDDAVDVPQMWLEAVGLVLATKLEALGGDPAQLASIQAKADYLENMMFDHDRPGSYQIGSWKYD